MTKHKAEVQSILRSALCDLTDPDTAEGLTEHMAFLLEGSMSLAGLERSPERIVHARALAVQLMEGLSG
ncbi:MULTISPECIES: hypothetical protein [Kocuria]|uniref:hypothetical protein n=1 Tax=Kocuria TaxID=57493 RepID=UPI0031587A13